MDITYYKNIVNKKINDNIKIINSHGLSNEALLKSEYKNIKADIKNTNDIIGLKNVQNKIINFSDKVNKAINCKLQLH